MFLQNFCILIFIINASAQYAYSEDKKNFWKPVDKTHDIVSQKIISLSAQIDAYFAGKKYEEETNNSYIKTGFQTSKYGNKPFNNEMLFKAKIELPKLEKKLNLIVEDIREFDNESANKNKVQSGDRVDRVQELTAALRFEFLKDSNWKLDNDAGIKVKLPLDPYYRFRVSWKKVLLERWYSYFSQRFSWFNSSGWESFTDFYFDTPIYPSLLFRFFNSAYWSDKASEMEWVHSLSLYKTYTPKLISQYYFSIQSKSKNEVTALQAYSVGANFRYKIYKEWLFLNINPSVSYHRRDNFYREYGALVGIELFMGSI